MKCYLCVCARVFEKPTDKNIHTLSIRYLLQLFKTLSSLSRKLKLFITVITLETSQTQWLSHWLASTGRLPVLLTDERVKSSRIEHMSYLYGGFVTCNLINSIYLYLFLNF